MTGYVRGAARVFDFSLGQMLWSRRTLFMAAVLAGAVLLAAVARMVEAGGSFRFNGAEVGPVAIFGMIVQVLFLRFVVPALGVSYGTSLVADEVEDRTITYLFTRPVRRGAILLGKYAAYLACTALLVLPAVMAAYFLLVPLAAVPPTFPTLVVDLGILALGLAAYGALFAWIGAVTRRPLVIGLVFAFGWEPVALLMPGYLRQFTLAYYLQALVPHALPSEGVALLLQRLARDVPGAATSVFWLAVTIAGALWLAVRAVERKEYVLEQ